LDRAASWVPSPAVRSGFISNDVRVRQSVASNCEEIARATQAPICFTVSVNRVRRAITHRQHRAANVKERPHAQSDDWPLSHVRGSVLVTALRAQEQRITEGVK
jgi:hypothetical protein